MRKSIYIMIIVFLILTCWFLLAKNLYITSYSFSIVKDHPFIRFVKINKITGATTLIITTGWTKEIHLPGYNSPPASFNDKRIFNNKQIVEGGRVNWQQVEQDIRKRKWEEEHTKREEVYQSTILKFNLSRKQLIIHTVPLTIKKHSY